MIRNIQIEGEPDTHPERPVHDARELAEGQVDLTTLRATRHCAKVFDLMSEEDRAAYSELYLDLFNRSKEGKILISSNVREVLTRKDGSTGWFRLLEWTEFDTSEILGA